MTPSPAHVLRRAVVDSRHLARPLAAASGCHPHHLLLASSPLSSSSSPLGGGAHQVNGPDLPSSRLKFDDHRAVFSHKTSWEILRGLLVLRIFGTDIVAGNALKCFRLSHRLFGERILGWILRPTIYAQFVAAGKKKSKTSDSADGSVQQQVEAVASPSLQQGSEEAREGLEAAAGIVKDLGLRLMVAPTLEGDVGEGGREELYDRNLQELLQLAEWAWNFGGGVDKRKPCLQVKATALLSADVLKVLAKRFQESPELERIKLVEQVAQTALNPSASVTGWRGIMGINKDTNDAIHKGARRLGVLGAAAQEKGLTLLVDAEFSYVNEAVSLLALAAMSLFNKNQPLVCHTLQCYFKGTQMQLEREIKMAEALGICYGAKVVRGAYLEQERSLAPGKESQLTCETHEETGHNYKRVISYFMEYAATKKPGKCLVFVATHNEDGIRHAVDKLHSLKISPMDGRIVFAQIYGMAEQISMPLVRGGYVVYKSVPVGGLTQVLPYLARRAAENRSVLLGARKERELLQSELLWRLKG